MIELRRGSVRTQASPAHCLVGAPKPTYCGARELTAAEKDILYSALLGSVRGVSKGRLMERGV